jgi:hypothetical protein
LPFEKINEGLDMVNHDVGNLMRVVLEFD